MVPDPIRVRIGLNAGEPVVEERDLYGTAVQRVARELLRPAEMRLAVVGPYRSDKRFAALLPA